MPRTTFVNSILGNWSSVIALITPIVDAGAKAADAFIPSPGNKIIKAIGNSLIKVFAPGVSAIKDWKYYDKGGKKHPPSTSYRMDGGYITLGTLQLAFSLSSFAFDICKYVDSDRQDDWDNLSLFLIGCGIICIGVRELHYKSSAEAEEEKKVKEKIDNRDYDKSVTPAKTFKVVSAENKALFFSTKHLKEKINLNVKLSDIERDRKEEFEDAYVPKPRWF